MRKEGKDTKKDGYGRKEFRSCHIIVAHVAPISFHKKNPVTALAATGFDVFRSLYALCRMSVLLYHWVVSPHEVGTL